MTRFLLTTRLVDEVCKRNNVPFASSRPLCRRLEKLREAGLIQRDRLLINGEFCYTLTKVGAGFVADTFGITIPARACSAPRLNTQAHEFALSQFLIKFFEDCEKLNVPIVQFWRDGQFMAKLDGARLVPDGLVLLRIRGKVRAFFLEMDRSTQTSGVTGNANAVVRQKFELYQKMGRRLGEHDELKSFGVVSMRLMVVCLSERRLQNLCLVAEAVGMGKRCAFTCWPRLIEVRNPNSARGWDYLPANLLAASLFSFSGRSPPKSILS